MYISFSNTEFLKEMLEHFLVQMNTQVEGRLHKGNVDLLFLETKQ